MTGLVNWIVDDWRLKLLAVALAVLMLGAVAFSQNPPTTKTLPVQLHYTTVGPNQDLVIINPPSKVNVTFSGLADAIGIATPDNFSATVDATHATTGPAVKLGITVSSTLPVVVQQPAPIVVKVDKLAAADITVAVVVRAAPGWAINGEKTDADPGTVHFVGPQSWEDHLAATVVVGGAVASTESHLLNQQVTLTNSGGQLNWTPCTTVPCATLDPPSVAVNIYAQTGTTSTTVPLNADTPSQPPPAGYFIAGVTVSPATVIITGDPTALAKIQRIILPAVDLSSFKTTVTITEAIPYPPNISPLNGVVTAKITYTIQKNPSVSPTP